MTGEGLISHLCSNGAGFYGLWRRGLFRPLLGSPGKGDAFELFEHGVGDQRRESRDAGRGIQVKEDRVGGAGACEKFMICSRFGNAAKEPRLEMAQIGQR